LSTTEAPIRCRNLAHRVGDGGTLEVWLNWEPTTNRITMTVLDHGTHIECEIKDHTKALDAFHHPYAYLGEETAKIAEMFR